MFALCWRWGRTWAIALLVLAALLVPGQGDGDVKEPEVLEIRWSSGAYQIPRTDQEMQQLYTDSLEPDLAMWAGRNLSAFRWWSHLPEWCYMREDTHRVVLVHNNTVMFPLNKKDPVTTCEMPCNGHMQAMFEALVKMTRSMVLPDTLFLLDSWDNYFGPCVLQASNCPYPLLAVIKKWEDPSRAGGASSEILVPQMLQVPEAMLVLPWGSKVDKGFFRGTSYCFGYHHGLARCSRAWLAHMSLRRNMSDVADVGLTNGYGVGSMDEMATDEEMQQYGPIPKVPAASLRDHARYRYLLNLDGSSASFRLAQLLVVNSLVLKQTSPYIEYYYRSIQTGQHYVSFWNKDRNDVFDIIQGLRNGTLPGYDKAKQKAMVLAAQQFAFKFTTLHARQLYWRRALQGYTALWPDMQPLVDKVVAELRAAGKYPAQQRAGGAGEQREAQQRRRRLLRCRAASGTAME